MGETAASSFTRDGVLPILVVWTRWATMGHTRIALEGVTTMQFNIRWPNVHWPKQTPRLRSAAMFLALVVMAVAGSAGTRWH
jgi:hypothetical protein